MKTRDWDDKLAVINQREVYVPLFLGEILTHLINEKPGSDKKSSIFPKNIFS